MKTAREVAADALSDEDLYGCGDDPPTVGVQRALEDAVTKAIEARDAEWEDRSVAQVMGEVQDERDALRIKLTVAEGQRNFAADWALKFRGLVERFVSMTPRSLDLGLLPFAELHDEARAVLDVTPVPEAPATPEVWQGSTDGTRWHDTTRETAMTFVHYRNKPR